MTSERRREEWRKQLREELRTCLGAYLDSAAHLTNSEKEAFLDKIMEIAEVVESAKRPMTMRPSNYGRKSASLADPPPPSDQNGLPPEIF